MSDPKKPEGAPVEELIQELEQADAQDQVDAEGDEDDDGPGDDFGAGDGESSLEELRGD